MKPSNLNEIREAEVHYDRLRWSPSSEWQSLDRGSLEDLRRDLSETIETLTKWLNRRLSDQNREYVAGLRRKLADFRWVVSDAIYKKEKHENLLQRLLRIIDPRPRTEVAPPPAYGLKAPLKGTPFYQEIQDKYLPTEKKGVA